jgi:hypothetical protein
MKTSGILLHILQICTSYFIHLYLIIFNFFAFPLFQWNFYAKTSGGTHLVSTTPPKSVGGFQWKFQTFFYIHWICTPKGYANAIWDLIIFNCFGFPFYTYSVVKIILNLTILQLIYTCFIEIHSQVKEG